jgi:hypothetical protein
MMESKKHQHAHIVLLCGLVLAASLVLLAPGIQAQDGGIVQAPSGGGAMASANYAVEGTLAQPAAGDAQSPNYGVRGGYWGPIVQYRVHLPLVLRSALP